MTALPSLTDIAADSCDARMPDYAPEFDAERLIATYQRSRDTLATMRRERPHMRSVHELCALADALFARWYGKA